MLHPLIPYQVCKDNFWEEQNWQIAPNYICAGDADGEESVCSGDSGGPLVPINHKGDKIKD